MKLFKLPLLALALTVLMPCQTQAKAKMAQKAYLYGFVANFTDSVVYFTGIQEVDSVWYDDKSKFLLGRSNYSYQLRDYFANKLDQPHRTCVTVFSLTRKEAEKKYQKLKREYTTKHAGQYDVRNLSESDFRFTAVDMTPEELDKKAEKAQKQKRQKPEKGKGKRPDGKRPPRGGGRAQ